MFNCLSQYFVLIQRLPQSVFASGRSQCYSDDSTTHQPPSDQDVQIPVYSPRANEPVETKRARILYQSRKRGMLENGILLR